MKREAVLLLAVVVFAATPLWAQGGPHRGRRMYDPHTVETVTGEVTSVDHVAAGHGRSGGVHLMLKTDAGTIPVQLGPAWYVDKQKPAIQNGDHVEVQGSRVSYQGKAAIIARQVKKGDETLTLRDEAGVPAWAGQGKGRMR